MKIKRFNNLWTMGLILCAVILLSVYLLKIFIPEFVVGVAEIPSIVKFGEFVDSHWWAKHLFNILTVFFVAYFYFCACCRKYKLSKKSLLVLLVYCISMRLISEFMPSQYTSINYVSLVLVPFIMCYLDNNISKETFISTAICFSVDILAQIMSIFIRDLTPMITKINSATFFILLIDGVIWRFLLYFYFNFKNKGV